MPGVLQRLWLRVRGAIFEDPSTFDESSRPSGVRRRALFFSLIASIIIWLLLSLSENYYIAVEYATCASQQQAYSSSCVEGLDADSALAQPLPKSIRTTLHGPGRSLLVERFQARFWSNPIVFDASVPELETQFLLRLPEEITIESIVPERINLQKEAKMERVLPIESRVVFVPQSPYFLTGEVQIDPDTVRVFGPASVVSQLEVWPTNSDTVEGVSDTVHYSVNLLDSLAGLVNLSIRNTTVKQLASQYTEGQKEYIRVRIEGLLDGNNTVQLDPEFVTITYQVPLSKFSEAQQSQFIQATVSYDQIFADTTGHVKPIAQYPPDLMLRQVTISPERLQYFINIGSQ